jgi:hypothetical protein
VLGMVAALLAGCGQPGGDAAQSEALVKDWIAAYETKDADRFLALYSDDVTLPIERSAHSSTTSRG